MHSTETRIYTAVLISFFILALVIIYFLVTIIRYQRKRAAVYSERLHTEIKSIENERLRIAQDLHDDIGSALSAIKFKLNAFVPGLQENAVLVQQCEKYLGETVKKLKDIVLGITPHVLQRGGLPAALHELLHRSFSADNIQVSCCCNIVWHNKESDIHIYRIVQEIIANIVKHAKATHVGVDLKMQDNNNISLHIQDNGVGFSKRAVLKNNTGQGLQNIISRVDMLNAKMYLTANPGKGAAYLIKIPVNNEIT